MADNITIRDVVVAAKEYRGAKYQRVEQVILASEVVPVAGTFTATGSSASLAVKTGRGINVTLRGTFVATVQVERSFDGGSNWDAITALGTPILLSATCSEPFYETEASVLYRLRCTSFTSGTVTYRISQ